MGLKLGGYSFHFITLLWKPTTICEVKYHPNHFQYQTIWRVEVSHPTLCVVVFAANREILVNNLVVLYRVFLQETMLIVVVAVVFCFCFFFLTCNLICDYLGCNITSRLLKKLMMFRVNLYCMPFHNILVLVVTDEIASAWTFKKEMPLMQKMQKIEKHMNEIQFP